MHAHIQVLEEDKKNEYFTVKNDQSDPYTFPITSELPLNLQIYVHNLKISLH